MNSKKQSKNNCADTSKSQKNFAIHLLAGGMAGSVEALTCHPLDTIKVRLQLRGERNSAAQYLSKTAGNMAPKASVKPNHQSFITVGKMIIQKEGILSLYKGIGAVVAGIVPKMAIRFSSFEMYKDALTNKNTGKVSNSGIFLAGLGAGVTEAVMVVTPMDVLKIRTLILESHFMMSGLQAQRHSMTDPLDVPKYRNVGHCAYVMIREEGLGSLYKGVTLTALRQSTNQAANFTMYQFLKRKLHDAQPDLTQLPWYQLLVSGFISGACGPLFNAPIDTIKTRIQKNPSTEKGWTRFKNVTSGILANEGWKAFYKGLVPRILRVAPGQAITFMVYENAYTFLIELSKKIKIEETRDKVTIVSSEL